MVTFKDYIVYPKKTTRLSKQHDLLMVTYNVKFCFTENRIQYKVDVSRLYLLKQNELLMVTFKDHIVYPKKTKRLE